MSTPAASTKSLSSASRDAQDATSEHKSPAPSNQDGADDAGENGEANGAGEGYPEQKHAGAVGLGPEYGRMRKAVSALAILSVD